MHFQQILPTRFWQNFKQEQQQPHFTFDRRGTVQGCPPNDAVVSATRSIHVVAVVNDIVRIFSPDLKNSTSLWNLGKSR